MEKEKKQLSVLLEEAEKFYNHSAGMAGLKRWKDSYEGKQEYPLVDYIYNYLDRKNRNASTRFFEIESFLKREVVESYKSPFQR